LKQFYDLIIVGAGPAGSIAARVASEKGISVLLLEKDRDVGYPVRCGEAVSKTGLLEFTEPDSRWIASEIKKFALVSPDDHEVVIEFKDGGFILERRIFDYELAKNAARAGAEIRTRTYVNGLIIKDDKVAGVKYLSDGTQQEVSASVVIAADGVESRVGRWAGLKTYVDFRQMESCTQVTVSNINVNSDTCYFYYGQNIAPEGYLWVFPKGPDTANIGIGVSGMIGKKKSAEKYLTDFLNKKFPDAPVLTKIAGGVPCGVTLDKISGPGILLTGDAARQVNPLSGAGIITGMVGGKIAAEVAAHSILHKDPDYLKNYDKLWNERLGKRHEIFHRIKNRTYSFSDEKYNSIAQAFLKVPYEKRTLGKLAAAALINQPSLLFDVAKVFFV